MLVMVEVHEEYTVVPGSVKVLPGAAIVPSVKDNPSLPIVTVEVHDEKADTIHEAVRVAVMVVDNPGTVNVDGDGVFTAGQLDGESVKVLFFVIVTTERVNVGVDGVCETGQLDAF